MTTFSVPVKSKDKLFFNFKVETQSVLFAGSRHLTISQQVCRDLINSFGRLGFSFITGCADGVDRSFRYSLALSKYTDKSITACAFKKRAKTFLDIINPLFVVPDGLPPRAALAKRTLWMTSRCSMLVLFPSDPIGKGSALAFRSAIHNSKPVFVISDSMSQDTVQRLQGDGKDLYSVYPSNLFGVADGYWCVPPVYEDTGLCSEPF
jgi:hypothetical protein